MKKVVSDEGRKWLDGRMSDADYFAKVFEDEGRVARRDVDRLLSQGKSRQRTIYQPRHAR